MVEIEKGLPLLRGRRTGPDIAALYQIDALDVGDSFTVPLVDDYREQAALDGKFFHAFRRRAPKKFSLRKVRSEGVTRVWRTA